MGVAMVGTAGSRGDGRGRLGGYATALTAVVLLLGACQSGSSPAGSSPRASGAPRATSGEGTTTSTSGGSVPAPADAQQAVVRAVVDGDTIEVAARAPGPALRSTSGVRVRLLEIDTPETHRPNTPVQCYGPEATDALRRMIPVGSTVRVQHDVERRDRYGRYLLYVWDARGAFVNLEMVRQGYAQAKLYRPNDRYWKEISAAGRQAKAAHRGVWGACPYFGAPRALGGATTRATRPAGPPAVAAPRPAQPRPAAPRPAVPRVRVTPPPAYAAPQPPPPSAPQSGDVYYPSCAAVKAAGAAPLHRGDPGYRAGLDRDGDGVACEP